MSASREKEFKEEEKSSVTLAFKNHTPLFTDADGNFSGETIGAGLARVGGVNPHQKGKAISFANGTHAGTFQVCAEGKKFYARLMHQGTTRVWDADGKINETRWEKLEAFVTKGQPDDKPKIVLWSRLKEYLDDCYKNDKPEPETGRRNFFFDKAWNQRIMAVEAWKEVYSIAADGHVDADPYITRDNLRLFFENTTKFFENVIRTRSPGVARGFVA